MANDGRDPTNDETKPVPDAAARARARTPRPPPLPRGSAFGRYVILEHLATGGMGEVYAAWDPQLDRKVALKRLRAGTGTPDGEARLLREARALARLSHPNVVNLHEAGTHQGSIFLAMEHVDGEPLNVWLKSRRRGQKEILSAFLEAGRGLAAAHDAGLVHRDFKPHNVIIGRDGRIRVLDFGLARGGGLAEATPQPPTGGADGPPLDGEALTAVTLDGVVMGTPGYMAPEQLRDEALDARTDQYAFCLSLYEALHGQAAFTEQQPESLVALMDADRLVPPLRPGRVPARIQRALRRGLRGDPARRHPSMQALLAALGPSRRLFGRAAAVAVGVLLGGGLSLAGLAAGARAQDPCGGGRGRAAQVWPAGDRAWARGALEPASEELAMYLGSVEDAWASGCEAARVTRTLPEESWALRAVCLDHRLRQARAVAGVLREADAQAAGGTLGAVRSLPPVESCADPQFLARMLPGLSESGEEPAADLHRDAVADLRALLAAGRYAEGRAAAHRALRAMEDEPRARAHAAFLDGRLAEQRGEWQDARAAFHLSAQVAEGAGDDGLRARALARLVGLLDRTGAAAAERGLWLGYAEAAARRAGGPAEILAELALLRASLDLDGARLADQLAVLEGRLPAGHPRIAEALELLGRVQQRRSELELARAALQRALTLREAAFGAEHPALAQPLEALGAVELAAGRPEAAAPHFARAHALLARPTEAGSPALAALQHQLCVAHRRSARLPEAGCAPGAAARPALEVRPANTR